LAVAHHHAMRRSVPLIALVLVLLVELPILIPPPFGLTDHLVFWKAGQFVLTGASPYDMANWAEAQRTYDSGHLKFFIDLSAPVWVYPAWTAYLFAPFGLLPFPVGPLALYLSYLAVGFSASVLFVRSLPRAWQPNRELALVLTALFQPLVIANRYGQFSAFLLLGLVLVFRGVRDRSVLPLTAGAVLLFMKPQLFLVVVPVVLVLLVRTRAWRCIGTTTAVLGAVALATTIRYPESLGLFGRGATERAAAFAAYSSTWAFAHYMAGDWWPAAGVAIVVVTAASSVAALRRGPPELRMAGLIAIASILSLAITPVDFHYDQVPLLLPLLLATAVGRRPYQIALTWGLGIVLPWCLFLLDLGLTGGAQLSGIVPLVIAVALAVSTAGSPAIKPSSPLIANTAVKLK
jgi:hypothetical protein